MRVVGWNLALLLAGVLVAEALFGGWFRAIRLWDLAVFRDVELRLDVSGYYPGGTVATYRRDHYGLRGGFGEPKDVAVLAVGGSTTDNRFLDENDAWPEQLGRCLNEHRRPAPVANAGVSGQSSRGMVLNFEKWLNHVPGLAPKVVVAFVGVNDLRLGPVNPSDDPTSYNESDRKLDRLALFRRWVTSNSALFSLWKAAAGNLQAYRKGLNTLPPRERPGETATEAFDRAFPAIAGASVALGSAEQAAGVEAARAARAADLQAYRQRLRRLVEAIRGFGAQPVLVSQAFGSYRRDGEQVRGDLATFYEMTAFNEVAAAVCAETGARCIPFGETIPWQAGDLYDEVHATPAGARKVAQAVCDGLLAADLPPIR